MEFELNPSPFVSRGLGRTMSKAFNELRSAFEGDVFTKSEALEVLEESFSHGIASQIFDSLRDQEVIVRA